MSSEKESDFHQKLWRTKNTSYHKNYVNTFCLQTISFLQMKTRIKNTVGMNHFKANLMSTNFFIMSSNVFEKIMQKLQPV